MKKLLLIALCSLSAMQTFPKEQAQIEGFLLPYTIEEPIEGQPMEDPQLAGIHQLLNHLHELVFLQDCTEEEAIAEIKLAQEKCPELFEALHVYAAADELKNIVDVQIEDINDIAGLMALIEELSADQKTEEQEQAAKEFKWLKGRMKVILSLFEKAGCKPLQK